MTERSELVYRLLAAWWEWSRIESGRPRGYARQVVLREAAISDEEAMEIDRAVCQLGKHRKDEYDALLMFLRCGGNLSATAGRLGISINTARLYVQQALAWLDAKLLEE